MTWLGRIFDRQGEDSGGGPPPVLNQRITDAPEFLVVLPGEPNVDVAALGAALRRYHPAFSEAAVQQDPAGETDPSFLGLVGWSGHVIRVIARESPLAPDLFQACVAPASYPEDLKRKVSAARSHVVLRYAGWQTDPFEQHVALAAAAGCLARQGGLMVVNPAAGSSLPTATLAPGSSANMLGHIQALSLLKLFAGYGAVKADDAPGIWLRTRGCFRFGLPDVAFYTSSRKRSQSVQEIFGAFMAFLRSSRTRIGPGDTASLGKGRTLQFRAPTAEEQALLPSPGTLLIAEFVAD